MFLKSKVQSQRSTAANGGGTKGSEGILEEDTQPVAPNYDATGSTEPPADLDPSTFPDHDDDPEVFAEMARQQRAERRAGQRRSRVSWPRNDADAPDYAHSLVAEDFGIVPRKRFMLTPQVIDLLIKANRFKVFGPNGRIVVALRGGWIVGEPSQPNVKEVEIEDRRPDHKKFRCMIGYYDMPNQLVSAFHSSTVPIHYAVTNFFRKKWNANPGTNMLPTGCYVFRRAGHKYSGNTFKIKPALRLTDPSNHKADGAATVLRSLDDETYTHEDYWHNTKPYDNVHCAYSKTSFSSYGCLTVQGEDGRAGPWRDFQKPLRSMPWDTPMSLVLLTGRDAAIAAEIIRQGKQNDPVVVRSCLERLRVGSEGEIVRQLQLNFGFSGKSSYFGPATRKRLTEREKKESGVNTDGTYSPADDEAIGWGLFEKYGRNLLTGGQQAAEADGATGAGTGGGQGGDSADGFGIDPNSLTLQPTGGANASVSGDGKTLTVVGEGIWRVGPGFGEVTFTPEPAFHGTPTPVRYVAKDFSGATHSALVSVTVKRVNQAPTAAADSAVAEFGEAVEVSVLENDNDPDGKIVPSSLKFAEVPAGSQLTRDGTLIVPDRGIWRITQDARLRFEPVEGFFGKSQVGYEITDNEGAKATATATVTVKPRLSLADDTGTTDQGVPLTIDVFDNDTLFGKPQVDDADAGATTGVGIGNSGPTQDGSQTPGGPATEPQTDAGSQPPVTTPVAASVPVPLVDADLKRFASSPKSERYRKVLVEKGDAILADYGINANPLRMAHFMAQVGHESGKFKIDRESLYYTTPRAVRTSWPSRFPTDASTRPYLRNEQALAARVYDNRPQLGNTTPGDGFKYRGRGLIQITGKWAYNKYGRDLGLDFVGNPELATDPETALRIAAKFWFDRKLNRFADRNDIKRITYFINGGYNGFASRKAHFAEAWSIWGSGEPKPRPLDYLARGDKGATITKLQKLLTQAGYPLGEIDGDFGGKTEKAVMRFQLENGLNVDGTVAPKTMQLLEAVAKEKASEAGARRSRTTRGQRSGETHAPSRRYSDRVEGPQWDLTENIRLISVLVAIAGLAIAVLSGVGGPGGSGEEQNWSTIGAVMALAGTLVFALSFLSSRDDNDDARENEDTSDNLQHESEIDYEPPPGWSDVETEGFEDERLRRSAREHQRRRFGETDKRIRDRGFDESYFEDPEPVRAAPIAPEHRDTGDTGPEAGSPAGVPSKLAEASKEDRFQALTETGSADPVIQVQDSLTPFQIESRDARFVLIKMFGGDNDLSDEVEYDLREMEAANSSGSQVAVLGLADLWEAPASVVEVTTSGKRRTVEPMGEIDTGDPEVLARFLSRALISFHPDTRIAIGFWDHGTGVLDEADKDEKLLDRSRSVGRAAARVRDRRRGRRGKPARRLFLSQEQREALEAEADTRAMLHDDLSGGVLTNLEAGKMLKAAFERAGRGSRPVDLMYSDTCLNGMIEVITELGDYADVFVASADLEPGEGWDYEGWINKTNRLGHAARTEDWAQAAVETYADYYRDDPSAYPITLGAFDTDNDIMDRFAELVDAASEPGQAGREAWRLLRDAREYTLQYDGTSSMDMYEFAMHLEREARAVSNSALHSRAQALQRAIATSRVAFVGIGGEAARSQGLAFWFPKSRSEYRLDIATYRRLEFARATGWAEYLDGKYKLIV
ncbi:MAG: clostripain-related cysteine peptidase [Filomicrobium sp.]